MMQSNQLLELIGATVLDSLWQGAIVFIIALIGLLALQKQGAKQRHNWLLICLLALPIGFGYSAITHYQNLSTNSLHQTTEGANSQVVNTFNNQLPTAQSTMPERASSSLSTWNISTWFGAAWLLGLMCFFLKTSTAFLQLKRLKAGATACTDERINKLMEQLKAQFSLKASIIIKESSRVASPLVAGVFKPIILFPIGLTQGLSTAEIEMILLHELAHLQRRDLLIHMVINGLKSVFFFHPVFWWLESQIDNEREFATDEWALSRQPNSASLASALAKTQEYKMLGMQLALAGRSKSQLLKRIYKIMNKKQQFNWSGALVTVFALSAILALTSMQTQQSEESPEYEKAEPKSINGTVKPNSIKIDSLGGFNGLVASYQSDTTKLNQAVLEIIQPNSAIDIKLDEKGEVQEITKNGKPLAGAEFKIFKKAHEQLNEYTFSRIEKSNAKWLKEMDARAELERQKEVELQQVIEARELIQKEELEQDLKLELMKREIELKRELIRISIEQKTALKRQNEQLLLQEINQSLDSMTMAEMREVEEQIQARMKEIQKGTQIFRGVVKSNDLGTYTFRDAKGKVKEQYVLEALNYSKYGKEDQLIDLDGELIDAATFNLDDLDLTTVEKVEYFANDEMRKIYPKRKVKGVKSVIRITTN